MGSKVWCHVPTHAPTLGRQLGTGKEADVFEYGDKAIKLFKPGVPKHAAFREASALGIAEDLRLPSPAVFGVERVGDRWGIVMARAEGPSFGIALAEQPSLRSDLLREMARLQVHIHRQSTANLPSLKGRLATNIRRATPLLGARRQQSMLAELHRMPEEHQLCHGDFHAYNVLGAPGRAIVIDWLVASRGPPAADVCRSYVLMRPSTPAEASAYVSCYCEIADRRREEIFAWLPVIAAARVAEDVPDEVDELLATVDNHITRA
jgi:aminoglycoside phosphotransferase (APT) family kinase protein